MLALTRLLPAAVLGVACVATGFAAQKSDDKGKAKPKVEFRIAEDKAGEGLTEAAVEGTRETVYLHKAAALTAEDIASAKAGGEKDAAHIEVTFTKAGAEKVAKLSEENKDKRLAVLVGGKVVSAPVVRAKIGGTALVTGAFTKAEAEKIAAAIAGK